MKILFVNPRYIEWTKNLPLGIAYLCAVLKETGFSDISVLDTNALEINAQRVAEEVIRWFDASPQTAPEILAVSAATPQINEAWKILESVKNSRKNVITILGGVHPTSLPDESLQKKYVDFVVRGEGEETIVELLRYISGQWSVVSGQWSVSSQQPAIENRQSALQSTEYRIQNQDNSNNLQPSAISHQPSAINLSSIAGLSYKSNGNIIHNKARGLIKQLDKIPFPARDMFPFPDKYTSPFVIGRRYSTIITSRGCPGRCVFCNKNTFGLAFRARSAENVVAEIEYLVKKYGIEEFHIADDCFSWDYKRVLNICDIILSKKLHIKWACSNGIRVDTVDKRMLRAMRKAGCYRLSLGIESGSDEILHQIGKKIDLSQVERAFNLAQAEGFITVALFMIGNMGEDETSIRKTIDFSKRLKTDYAQFTIAVPFPGTPFYNVLKNAGQITVGDWSKFGVFDEPLFETEKLSKELLLHTYKIAYRQFYFRPRQILFMLKKRIRYFSIKDIKQLVGSLKQVWKRTRK